MQKIYRFDSINQMAITVDETQPEPNQVILRVHSGDDMLVLQFDKDEFDELCNLKYRLDFPEETPQKAQSLALVAA